MLVAFALIVRPLGYIVVNFVSDARANNAAAVICTCVLSSESYHNAYVAELLNPAT